MSKTLFGPSQPTLSGNPARQLIILLHGYGSNGDDLFGLVPMLASHFPDAAFISPNAPFPCGMNPHGGFEWFPLTDYSPNVMLAGAERAAPILNHFIDEQLAKHKLSEKQLALVGFSQGTMMSLHVALRRHKAIAGVVGFSGSLLQTVAHSKPPICLIHGTADNVVPFAAMKAAETLLKQAGVAVETHARPGLPHSIDGEGLQIATTFMKKVLA